MEFDGSIVYGALMLFSFFVLANIGHELAHYIVARLLGFTAPVFGVGLPLGPYLAIAKKWGTEFRLHLLLIGSYTVVPGLDSHHTTDTPSDSGEKSFPLWKKLSVVLAGPAFYVLFAWISIFISLSALGQPDFRVMVQDFSRTTRLAQQAGVLKGDQIVGIDSTKVGNTDDVIKYLATRPETAVELHVLRNGHPIDLTVVTNSSGKLGLILISRDVSGYHRVSFVEAIGGASTSLWKIGTSMVGVLAMMFAPGDTGSASSGAHGVSAIVAIGADALSDHPERMFDFLALLSLDLALIGLTPWPGWDGGHLVAVLYNAFGGRFSTHPALRWLFAGCIVLNGNLFPCLLRANAPKPKTLPQEKTAPENPG